MNSARDYEYDLDETIAELDGWLNRGKRFYPVDTANSAVYWLQKVPGDIVRLGSHPTSCEETVACLRAWLSSPDPYLPEWIGEAALYWLKRPWPENLFVSSSV